jgi:hypothetical protein
MAQTALPESTDSASQQGAAHKPEQAKFRCEDNFNEFFVNPGLISRGFT